MSFENLDLERSIYAARDRGDYRAVECADADIALVIVSPGKACATSSTSESPGDLEESDHRLEEDRLRSRKVDLGCDVHAVSEGVENDARSLGGREQHLDGPRIRAVCHLDVGPAAH